MSESSTKPYLIRAIHEWCSDNGFTPYIAVAVDARTTVPREHVRNGEIVLNVSTMATQRLTLGNDLIEFQARFGGQARELSIPVENVTAIYARENGHGMAFEVPKAMAVVPADAPVDAAVVQGDAPVARDGPLASVPTLRPADQAESAPAAPVSVPAARAPAPVVASPARDSQSRPPQLVSVPSEQSPAAPLAEDDDRPDPAPSRPRRPKLTRIK